MSGQDPPAATPSEPVRASAASSRYAHPASGIQPLAVIERARAVLGLAYEDVARAVLTDGSTLYRWRTESSVPGPAAVSRLGALHELLDAIERTFMAPGPIARWFDSPLAAAGHRSPRQMLADGRGDFLLGLLAAEGARAIATPTPTQHVATLLDHSIEGFLALDLSWRVTHANRRAAEMLQRPPEALVGRTVFELAPGMEHGPFFAAYRRALDEQQPVEVEGYSATAAAWVVVRVFPSLAGVALFFRDVSVKYEARADRDQLRSITDALGLLVLAAAVDADVPLAMDAPTRALLALPADAPADAPPARGLLRALRASWPAAGHGFVPGRPWRGSATLVRPGGTTLYVRQLVLPPATVGESSALTIVLRPRATSVGAAGDPRPEDLSPP